MIKLKNKVKMLREKFQKNFNFFFWIPSNRNTKGVGLYFKIISENMKTTSQGAKGVGQYTNEGRYMRVQAIDQYTKDMDRYTKNIG